eukprot:6114059-Pyramimonas_sp.AAC.1
MEVWCAELQEERELLEATPPEDLLTIPAQMVPDQSVLITTPRRRTAPQCVPWSKTTITDWAQTNGQYVELCFTAEMSGVVLSEQQHMILDADRVTTMRVYVTAAAIRAVVVKGDNLLANADVQ